MTYENNTFFRVVVTYRIEQRFFTKIVNSGEDLYDIDEIISVTPDPDCFNPLKRYNPCF